MAHHFNTVGDLKAHIQQLADRANAIADKNTKERECAAERATARAYENVVSILENSFIGEDIRTAVPLIDSCLTLRWPPASD
jgi:hypothetical protein